MVSEVASCCFVSSAQQAIQTIRSGCFLPSHSVAISVKTFSTTDGNFRKKPARVLSMTRQTLDPSVYLVTDRRTAMGATVDQVVRAAVTGSGKKRATIVQLRDKNVSREESIALGKKLRDITRSTQTTFIVNDDISLAKELQADGVHLGQDDAPVSTAREALGKDAIIGVSAGTPDEAERAYADGADYVGVGAVFHTASKADAGEPIGRDGLKSVVDQVNGRMPVVAIGGVSVGNAAACRDAGADGVAVVSAIMSSENPAEVAAQLYAIMRPEQEA